MSGGKTAGGGYSLGYFEKELLNTAGNSFSSLNKLFGRDDYSEKVLTKLREIAKSLGADIYEDGGAPSNEI